MTVKELSDYLLKILAKYDNTDIPLEIGCSVSDDFACFIFTRENEIVEINDK